MIKTVIFARVSTSVQEYDRQVNELTALANGNGWNVEAVFAEKISGAKANLELSQKIQNLLFPSGIFYGISRLRIVEPLTELRRLL